MSLAGDEGFGGGLDAVRRLLAKGEGAGLGRRLDVALDKGMPKAARGAGCRGAFFLTVQSVFIRSSMSRLIDIWNHQTWESVLYHLLMACLSLRNGVIAC
jgi:hypothetical protein